MENTGDDHSKEPVRLVFAGSPLLDICASCDAAAVQQHGLVLDDCVLARDEHDALFSELFARSDAQRSAGGSAQNSARIAKWVLGDRAHVSFAGCAGEDEFEGWMRERVLSEGVEPLYVTDPQLKTGVCACLLGPGGTRSMCTRLGAGATFRALHVGLEFLRERLLAAHGVFVEGYFLGHSPDAVQAMLDMFAEEQMFGLSLSAAYICTEHTTALLSTLPRVDVLLGNAAEMTAFAKVMGAPHNTTAEESVRWIHQLRKSMSRRPCVVMVTQGSDPVLLINGDGDLLTYPVPGGITVVDGVGCGDALAGAFVAAFLASRRNVESAVKAGIRAAAAIAQVAGCNPPSDTKFELA